MSFIVEYSRITYRVGVESQKPFHPVFSARPYRFDCYWGLTACGFEAFSFVGFRSLGFSCCCRQDAALELRRVGPCPGIYDLSKP